MLSSYIKERVANCRLGNYHFKEVIDWGGRPRWPVELAEIVLEAESMFAQAHGEIVLLALQQAISHPEG